MAKTKVNAPANVVERNIVLVGQIMQYLLDNPAVLDSLPDEFELVVLPEDDPEMRLYNLDLLDSLSAQDKPVVFARAQTKIKKGRAGAHPSLFIPLLPAAS